MYRWIGAAARRARLIRHLLESTRVTVHVLEPGGVAFVSGVDIDDEEERERVRAALGRLSPDVLWVSMPREVTVDAMSPAMVAAILSEAHRQDSSGGVVTARESDDQMISARCPRCNDDVWMSVVTTMSVSGGRLMVRALADPTDVEVHDLRCNG